MRKSSQPLMENCVSNNGKDGGIATQPSCGASNTAGVGVPSSESYSSNSSEFSESYSNSSDLANWEEYVASDGTLFYAEYMPHSKCGGTPQNRVEFSRSSSLRTGKKSSSTSKRSTEKTTKTNATHATQQPQFKLSAIKNAENFKELDLFITAADRYRFGRRSSAVESILGFSVTSFIDQPECLMVENFVHDMTAMQQSQDQQTIKRGDWFKSLDNIEVRAENIDDLLLQFVQPTKVTLKFQGPSIVTENGSAADGTNEYRKVENFEKFSQAFGTFYQQLNQCNLIPSTSSLSDIDDSLPFAILILPPEFYNGSEKESIFYYPQDLEINFLYKARGSFITLNAVLTEELKSKPLLSVLIVGKVEYFVSYRTLNGFLMTCAFSSLVQTKKEAELRSDEILLYLRFAFPNFSLPFVQSEPSFSHKALLYSCEIIKCRVLGPQPAQLLFEELLKESRHLALPKEAQLRIFDALSEMEAMDYRNWNDEPLNTYREFFIYGSVLYFDCYMLVSQLPVEIRVSLESFLRCCGIFDFITLQNVKELYVWEEIILPNATGRYFLTICNRSHLLLAVILKTYDASTLGSPATVISPSLFYIEEIQETLDHLIQCGIESLATFWSVSNKRPEVQLHLDAGRSGGTGDFLNNGKEHRKYETFLRHKSSSSGGAGSGSSQQRRSISYDEDAHLCSSLGGSSIHSLTASEDDSSKRRINASGAGNGGDDSDSASDWEGFGDQNTLLHPANEGTSQMTESLWKEINNVVPVKLSAGWRNAIFYYIYVDSSSGTIFCPMKGKNETFEFLREMRSACHLIHNVLQNTKKFRRLLAQESSKVSTSKGLVAIKEHGITIAIKESETASAISGRFVVVGRLFFSPAREVYVCHRPDVPQNMVEMAFRLSFFSAG